MWMMGYNDGGDLYMHHDSFNNSRRLRPLMPRPVPTATSLNGVATGAPPPGFSCIHGADILTFNHHFEQSKRDQLTTTQQVVVSSRWNPTPEQLRTLEELYRRGTRTPSADQIQQITAQLRRYGKIEGKNVFYWFQNHKARERQKRRRQMESGSDDQNRDAENPERKETGGNRAVIEAEQTKNWTPSSNCSTLAEESVVSVQKAAKASTVTEFRTTTTTTTTADHRWVKFMERNDTWPSMHGSSCPRAINTITAPPPSSELSREIIMDHNNKITRTTTATITTNHDLLMNNVFLTPCKDNSDQIDAQIDHYCHYDNSEDGINSQTLELFPLRSGGGQSTDYGTDEKGPTAATPLVSVIDDFTTRHQFFEFLPIKH